MCSCDSTGDFGWTCAKCVGTPKDQRYEEDAWERPEPVYAEELTDGA